MFDSDEDLEALFISETFHKCEPIRSKSVNVETLLVQKVWIKDFKIDENGDKVKVKAIKNKINDRFTQLQTLSHKMGLHFEDDEEDDDDDDDNGEEDDDQFEDTNTDENLNPNRVSDKKKHKLMLSLAQKLKKKSIANRLGIAYKPGKNRLKESRNRTETKSWSEKFGRLLAAKKLLYLPLLYRKYNSGPKRTREELDIEIDLYMSEVKKTKNKKDKLAFDEITNAVNNENSDEENEGISYVNNGITVINRKKFSGGFGGPKWKKRVKLTEIKEQTNKESLDMDIDDYMKNKDVNGIKTESEYQEKDELDMDLDNYMARVKKNAVKKEIISNGFK